MGTLADYGITVTPSMTTPSKPGKQPRPVWNVEGATSGYEATLYDLGGKKWRGAFSFWSDPSEALLEAIERDGRQSFGERLEAKRERAEERAERYSEYAANAEQRSNAAHEKFRAILDPIPMGQPILVGHHSERRHRRALERADNAMRQAVEENEKAKHYKGKAFGASCTAGEKSLPFMHRRLKEANAELRRMQRHLADVENHRYTPEVVESERKRYTRLVAEYQEQVEYWQAQIATKSAKVIETGGGVYSRADVAKGDVIVTSRRGAYIAERVNALSVSVSEPGGGTYVWKHTIPYAEIAEVIKPTDERHAALMAKLAEVNA